MNKKDETPRYSHLLLFLSQESELIQDQDQSSLLLYPHHLL